MAAPPPRFSIPKKGKKMAVVAAGAPLKTPLQECAELVVKSAAAINIRSSSDSLKLAIRGMKQLAIMRVSAEQLLKSGAVKEIKSLRTHSTPEIANLAKQIITGWRILVEKGQSGVSAATFAPPPAPPPTTTPDSSAELNKGSNSSKANSEKKSSKSKPELQPVPEPQIRTDLPCGATSAKDLRWVNGAWVHKDAKHQPPPPTPPTGPDRPRPTSSSSSLNRSDGRVRASSATHPPPRQAAYEEPKSNSSSKSRKRKGLLPPGWESDSDEDLDGVDPLAAIRKMFRYDPSKFQDADEDDRDMVASFDQIQSEERRSAKLGKQFDKEEEERERKRKEEKERRKKEALRNMKRGGY